MMAKRALTILALAFLSIAGALVSSLTFADEGGVSFWFPGQYGSLAAVPSESGFSLPLIYYHNRSDGEGDREFAQGGNIRLGLDEELDFLIFAPTYVFASPVLGGQAAVSVAGAYGRVKVDADATLTGPGGAVLSGSESDSNTGFADLYPSVNLRWNHDVHNTMFYIMGGVPVGSYAVDRLANIGLNHWSLDAGGGYTYLNTKTGREFSVVAGLTYNFKNPDTDYQNGINAHLTGDSGSGAVLGNFKSRVYALGPQVGYLFKMGESEAYLNLKGYWEFGAENRPEGYNVWLTFSLPIGGYSK
jgi:hypothetical protein